MLLKGTKKALQIIYIQYDLNILPIGGRIFHIRTEVGVDG
jgi:hypothetical protein